MLELVAALAIAAAPPRDAAGLAGTWRGTSTCLRPPATAACKDEVVVHRFEPLPTGAVRLHAFKLVNGEEQLMGDLDLTLDAATGWWSGEFRNARVHVVWSYAVHGDDLEGRLETFDTRARLRVVAARREQESGR